MPALRSLRVQNYLSLREVKVELGPINVLVGPNNAGKSNLLDVIAFLRDAVRSDLRPALDRRGGYFRVRYRGKNAGPVEISLTATVTQHSSEGAPDEYDLWLSGRRFPEVTTRYFVRRRETFRFKRTKGRDRRLTIAGTAIEIADDDALVEESRPLLQKESLALATLPRLADEAGGAQVRDIAELFATFKVFDIDVREARRPKPVWNPLPLHDDGSNLAPFLMYLMDEHTAVFERLQSDAKKIIPGFLGIEFEWIGGEDDAVVVVLDEQGLTDSTRISEASYGTVRALALLALLHDPSPPKLTCIEEFDHGLHPYAFDLLVERLRAASKRTQFLIATHSPALVNRLHADEIIVCERDAETGASRIPAIESDRVRAMERAMEGKMGLGELWFSGALGGVPQV